MMVATAAAITFATPAFADVTVRVTGSTAFRAATNAAINNVFLQAGNSLTTYGYAGTSTSGASFAVWKGTISGIAGNVFVKTAFQGSTGGVQTLDQNKTRSDWGADTWSGASQTGTDGTTLTADVSATDSFQAATIYTAGAGSNGGLNPLVDKAIGVVGFAWVKGNAASTGGVSGAVPPAGSWTNMTSLNARSFLGGKTSLQLFTGNVADNTKFAIAQGRDEDSGTRLEAFAVSGFGTTTKPLQYESNYTASPTAVSRVFVSNSGGAGYTSAPTVTITGPGGSGATATALINAGKVYGFTLTNGGSGYTGALTATLNNTGTGFTTAATARAIRGPYIAPHQPQIVLGDFQAIGTSGYASGGTLATQVNNVASLTTPTYTSLGIVDGTIPVGSFYPCSYMGKSDVAAVNAGKNALSYDGVFYLGDGTGLNGTEHPEVIQNGQYSFWSFAHLMYRASAAYYPGGTTDSYADKVTVADKIALEARTNTAGLSGVTIGSMTVTRATDGGSITLGAPTLP